MQVIKDAKRTFDITRPSESLTAALFARMRRDEVKIYRVQCLSDGIYILVGDTRLDVPLDNLQPDVVLYIPLSFYEKSVVSEYGDNILPLAMNFTNSREVSRLASYFGSLISLQTALVAHGYYDERNQCRENRISELLGATFKFGEAWVSIQDRFYSMLGIDKNDPSLWIDISIFLNQLTDVSKTNGILNDGVKNVFPFVLSMTYIASYFATVGATLAIANGASQNIAAFLDMSRDPQAASRVFGIITSSNDIVLKDDEEGNFSQAKKALFGLLVAFYKLHTYFVIYTGFGLNDPYAVALANLGKVLDDRKRDSGDDDFMDESILYYGKDDGVCLQSLTEIPSILIGYNSIGVFRMARNSNLPFSNVATMLPLLKSTGAELYSFYINPFTRIVSQTVIPKDNSIYEEMVPNLLKTIIAEAQVVTGEFDPYLFFRISIAAAFFRYTQSVPENDGPSAGNLPNPRVASEKDLKRVFLRSIGEVGITFCENYLTALYIRWCKSGVLYPPEYAYQGDVLGLYHSLHKEVLAIICIYQNHISLNAGFGKQSYVELIYSTIDNIYQSWLYESETVNTHYLFTVVGALQNMTPELIEPLQVARAISSGSIAPTTSEAMSLSANAASIGSIVDLYNRSTNTEQKRVDIESVKSYTVVGLEKDIVDQLNDSFVGRCVVHSNVAKHAAESVSPLEFVTYYHGVVIEFLIGIWNSQQASSFDAKMIMKEEVTKNLITNSTFIGDGIVKTFSQAIESYNPLKRR